MNKKKLLIIISIITLFTIIILLLFKSNKKYNNFIINEDEWNNIINNRVESKKITLESIQFNDYSLLIDETNNKIYYSLIQNNSKRYNPSVSYKTSQSNSKIAILNDKISDEYIENNHEFKIMIYNDKEYHIYILTVTNLPILNISYNDIKKDSKHIPVQIYLFNNLESTTNRILNSNGELNIIDNGYDKKDYTFSLFATSPGGNERENNISVLNMNKHSEYFLNSLYNDEEKIRYVFSTNLWNETTEEPFDEYHYVELFINDEYVGLYALGYNIERENLGLRKDEFIFYKNKNINSEILSEDISARLDGYILYNNNIKRIKEKDDIYIDCKDSNKDNCKKVDTWGELNNYYNILNSNNINQLKKLDNMENAIDIYLFYILTQASDNICDETFNNTYMVFRKDNDKYKVEYIPWNLNNTFGNYMDDSSVLEYYIDASNNNFIMQYNPVYRLIELNDEDTINKVKEEYKKLRNGAWSLDNIIKMLDDYEEDIFLSGAYIRDITNWKDSNQNFNNKLAHFKEYITNRLEYMDKYIDNL